MGPCEPCEQHRSETETVSPQQPSPTRNDDRDVRHLESRPGGGLFGVLSVRSRRWARQPVMNAYTRLVLPRLLLLGCAVLLAACGDGRPLSGELGTEPVPEEMVIEPALTDPADIAAACDAALPLRTDSAPTDYVRVDTVSESLCLAPALLDGRVLESVNLDDADVVRVELTFSEEGIVSFNQIAASCFNREPLCGTGRTAIAVGGRVVSAPTIQAASFERDQIVITGAFDITEGSAIVARINNSPSGTALEFRTVVSG